MREQLKTELGKYIYDYGPLLKIYITKEVLFDLSDSFCIRNNAELISRAELTPGINIVTIKIEDEGFELYVDWARSFEDHGYSAPLLDVVSSQTPT